MTDIRRTEPKEISIPVSYGIVAGKAWGQESGHPVLALHGWQDNAGTFDKLSPLLSSELYLVAIDLPGHGLSSHKPPGHFYQIFESLHAVRSVVSHFKWKKFSFLCHSLGGASALLYSSIYPEQVASIITVDFLIPPSCEAKELPMIMRDIIEKKTKLETKMQKPPPVYNIKTAKERFISGRHYTITETSAETLLKRSIKPSVCGKGVVFSRDIRIHIDVLPVLSHDAVKAYAKNLQCHFMILVAKNSNVRSWTNPKLLNEILDAYKMNCRSFTMIEVEGNHFVHLNNPENVAPHINNFFESCLSSKNAPDESKTQMVIPK